MKILSIVLFPVLGLAAGGAAVQKDKPWTDWTAKDVEKILNQSPWGQTQVYTNTREMTYSPANRGGGLGALNEAVSTNFRIRFLSAKPIRLALLRHLELNPSAGPAVQIQAAREFAEQTFDDTIVVAVAWDSKDPRYNQLVFAYFSSAVTSTLRNNCYLEIKGGKRNFLQEYQPPAEDGLGGKFIFARSIDGSAFLDARKGDLHFFAQFPMLSGVRAGPIPSGSQYLTLDMRFTIADLMYNGVLEY